MKGEALDAGDAQPRGALAHPRHETSILFSAETLRALVATPACTRAAAPIEDASETVVPIALAPPLWQDAWLWRSLTLATTTELLVLFVVALELFLRAAK